MMKGVEEARMDMGVTLVAFWSYKRANVARVVEDLCEQC